MHAGRPGFHAPDPLRASRTVRFLRVPRAEPGDWRPPIDARPRRTEGLVPFERNLARGDGLRARLLSFCGAYDNHRRALVSQPGPAEECQFLDRHRADVL